LPAQQFHALRYTAKPVSIFLHITKVKPEVLVYVSADGAMPGMEHGMGKR